MEKNQSRPPRGSIRAGEVARARVTKEMHKQLMDYARKYDVSPSEIIRTALEMYFKAMEKDAK